MIPVKVLAKVTARAVGMSLQSRFTRYRAWPPRSLLLDDPLALAEERTTSLLRIYDKATDQAWDGPQVFREAVNRHGGIQLDRERRIALSHPISMLMWGELGAWLVSAELALRLDDADARRAASSQVFDEARHFYILRDYLALLHVPVPPLDPYFGAAVRLLLADRDLTVKLLTMQILAEGTAQAIFGFLGDHQVEPVLSEILPYIERDEARHVGLGILHLPERMAAATPRQCRRIADKVGGIGDLFGATQLRYETYYRQLGLDPQELFRRADRILHGLSTKLGNVPGTDRPYFHTFDPDAPAYQEALDFMFPPPDRAAPPMARAFRNLIDTTARLLPA